MKKLFNTYRMLCLYAVLFTAQLVFSTYSLANTKKNTQCKELKKELKSRRDSLITAQMDKSFKHIHRDIGKKGKEEATLNRITELEEREKKRPHNVAKAYCAKAQLYFGSDQIEKASEYYNKAIALKVLPYNDHMSVLHDLARVYMYQSNFQKADEIVEQLFCLSDKAMAQLYVLKSFILMERGQKKQALEMIMKALEMTSRPPESWVALAAGLQLEMENYVSAAKLLTTLTAHYPDKKKYWKQLSAVYVHTNKENEAVVTLDLADKQDFLEKESEILNLSGLLMAQGQPFKAAKLIEKSMEQKKIKSTKRNYEILGDCWSYANEMKKALSAYEKAHQIASNSKDKKDWKLPAKIGNMHYNQEAWGKSVKYFRSALAVKEVKHPEQLYINTGVALYRLKRYEEAIRSFEKVITPKATSQFIKVAREWIDSISNKYLNQIAETIQ